MRRTSVRGSRSGSEVPVDRTFSDDEARDWDHFTDYTHHKFLLVDRNAASQAGPSFALDKGSLLAYLENLPFDAQLPPEQRQRIYGALAGKEAQAGKHIHDAWLRALPGVCAGATPGSPKRIILHNAYFFPPANLTYARSRLVNRDYNCSNVTVTVLTNSIDTTDLNVVNLVAGQVLKEDRFNELFKPL